MGQDTIFDAPDDSSPFLSFVRSEFMARGTQLRKDFASKEKVKDLIAHVPIRVPKIRRTIEKIEDLKEADLGDSCVLKYAYGFSARGVMILERIAPGKYLDHMSTHQLNLVKIRNRQARIPATFSGKQGWIIEERLKSPLHGRPIPFDYKFYCFREKIGMIAQIDRNTTPAQVCLMDENFRPLRHRVDYVLLRSGQQLGVPVIPRHAGELRHLARELSLLTDSPFVSIDLYDDVGGPAFGEFTFSPGGTFRRMWAFSQPFLKTLDEKFRAAERMETPKLARVDATAVRPDGDFYAQCATSVAVGNTRGAIRLSDFYREAAAGAPPEQARLAEELATAWMDSRILMKRRARLGYEDRLRFAERHLYNPAILSD